jgi:hypothetical protein
LGQSGTACGLFTLIELMGSVLGSKWTILHILRWLAFCAKSAKLSWVKVMFFYEVAKNLSDVAHLAHVTCYLYLGIWNMQVRCWEIQSNGGSVPKAAISHDHPVRLKKILHDYLNSFQAKTVSNSNVKRGHCVWVMDAKAIFGRNGD